MESSTLTLWIGLYPIVEVSSYFFIVMFYKKNKCKNNAKSVDPDHPYQTARSATSHLGLHILQMSLLWDARHKWVNVFLFSKIWLWCDTKLNYFLAYVVSDIIKGNRSTLREGNSLKIVVPYFCTVKRNDLLPLSVDIYSQGDWYAGKKTKSHKSWDPSLPKPAVKDQQIYKSIFT